MGRPLYGIHDAGGEHLLPTGSTIVITEAIGHNPNDLWGRDYRQWSERGYTVLVRLNNGYGPEGTLPAVEHYGDFARRCANFVKNSAGCTHWIIGNEPNHGQEWPQGQPISAHEYAGCFRMVAKRIFEVCGEHHLTIAAAVAPWNVQMGDWLLYQRTMLAALQDHADGIAIHTYTHGTDPALVTSDAKMDAPGFTDRYFHFRAYRDLMNAIPEALRDLPVWITETDQDEAWADINSGWVVAAYGEIDAWNRQPGNQQIHCVALYRWMNHDKWGFSEKRGVQEDLVAAVTKGFITEGAENNQGTSPLPSPEVEGEEPTSPQPSPVERGQGVVWDGRLTQRGVSLLKARVPAGTTVYRLVHAEYLTPGESGGNANIYVDVLDENGVRVVGAPVVQSWDMGSALQRIEEKHGEKAGTSFLMTSAGNPYHVHVGGEGAGAPSDVVQGMGLGTIEEPDVKHHVGYSLVFQRVVEPAVVEPAPGGEIPQVFVPIVSGGNSSNSSNSSPAAPEPVAVDSEANWQRAYPFVLNMEGGFSTDPNDKGNYTPSGEFKGTKFGISARSYPHLDIRNLTREQALEIYKRDYWDASGAAQMAWPLCLAVLDTAINHGVGAAQRIYARKLSEIELFQAKRMLDYITYSTWPHHGVAWGNRVRHLLKEAEQE